MTASLSPLGNNFAYPAGMKILSQCDVLVFVLFPLMFFSVRVNATPPVESKNFQCAWIVDRDQPQKSPERPVAQENLWCFYDLEQAGQKSRIVFQAHLSEDGDFKGIRAGLSAKIDLDAQGKPISATQQILDHGQTKYLKSDLHEMQRAHPFALPIEMPQDARRAHSNFTSSILIHPAMDQVLAQWDQVAPQLSDLTLHEGEFSFSIDEKARPYRGYWWPFGDLELSAGEFSPLGKYDSYVAAKTGTNPGAVEWETQNHSLQTVKWGGHCNGWAASSLLYQEPSQYLWDGANKHIISLSDQKGMLAEASYCVKMAFYGHRYYGSGDDIKDIYPDLFHQVLMYYIRDQKRPVIEDYFANEWVDNHIIGGYHSVVKKTADHQYDVVTDLTMYGYDLDRNEKIGVEDTYIRSYHYRLTTDDHDVIVKGEWVSENPDFMWVPLAQDNCPGENPKLDPEKIAEMMHSLPQATPRKVEIGFSLGRALGGHEEIDIPLPSELHGTEFKIQIDRNNLPGGFLGGKILLLVQGHPRYPRRDNDDLITQTIPLNSVSQGQVHFDGQDIISIHLRNNGVFGTSGHDFAISKIDFVGGE